MCSFFPTYGFLPFVSPTPGTTCRKSNGNNLEFVQVPTVFPCSLCLFLSLSLQNIHSSKSCFMKTRINFLKREVGGRQAFHLEAAHLL